MDELCEWLVVNYGLPCPVECRLMRSYTNDVYQVNCRDLRCILKIYGKHWRTASEIKYEIALLQHLASRGLAVAQPLPGNEGKFVKRIKRADSSDTYQHAVLFEQAPGVKPQSPFSLPLYSAFGRAIGRMHELSVDFTTPHRRPPLNAAYVIDAPVSQIIPLLAKPEDQKFLNALARRLKKSMTLFASKGLDWGPIHGDASMDNLHITTSHEVIEVTLYDFDSGGLGWRAADLQGWAVNNGEYHARWDAFHEGYSHVRSLSEIDLLAAPYLTLAWHIWGIKIDLDNRVISQGPERVRDYLSNQITLLHEFTERAEGSSYTGTK